MENKSCGFFFSLINSLDFQYYIPAFSIRFQLTEAHNTSIPIETYMPLQITKDYINLYFRILLYSKMKYDGKCKLTCQN